MLFLIGVYVKVEGTEHIKKGEHYLVMANHSSYADIPVLFRTLPLYLRFIGKEELRKVPFLGFYMRMAGMVFIDRSNPRKARKSIKHAADIVTSGKNVVIFPEGTTIIGEEIAPFKRGVTYLAKESRSVILPVRIKGSHKAWPGDSNFKIRGGRIQVTIGEPIPYERYKDKSTPELLKEWREIMEQL